MLPPRALHQSIQSSRSSASGLVCLVVSTDDLDDRVDPDDRVGAGHVGLEGHNALQQHAAPGGQAWPSRDKTGRRHS